MTGLKKCGVLGLGHYIPDRVITNDYFVDVLGMDTSDEWIYQRSGIKERRWARDDEYTSDMATEAAKKALASANKKPEEIDFLLIGTCTPDYQFPNTANIVHKNLGLRPNCGAIDTPSACSSFLYALTLARPMVMCGEICNALVIGVDKLTAITNFQDRGTCVLFSDSAGAVVLGPTDCGSEILSTTYGCELNFDVLNRPMSGIREMPTHEGIENLRHLTQMKGNAIYSFAVRKFHDEILHAVKKAGLTINDVNYIVPHQVNMRIISSAVEKLGFPMERVYVNLDRLGNSSAGTIPVALSEAAEKGWFKKGDIITLVAFGGGLSWGASVIRW